MKKNKSKSKNLSASKKVRKELESKLIFAFNEVVGPYGQAKKTDKVMEKFAKQLSKKVNIAKTDDSFEPFLKEEEQQKPVASEPATKTRATKSKVKEQTA